MLDFSIKYFLLGRKDDVDGPGEGHKAKPKPAAKQVLVRTGLRLDYVHFHRVLKICLCAKFFDVMDAPIGAIAEKNIEYRCDKTRPSPTAAIPRPYWKPRLTDHTGKNRVYDYIQLYRGTNVFDDKFARWVVLKFVQIFDINVPSGTFKAGPYSNGAEKIWPTKFMWGVQCGEVMARQNTHASTPLPQAPPLNIAKLTAALKTAVGYDYTALHDLIKEIPHVAQDQIGHIIKTALATAKTKTAAPTWVSKANLATSDEITALKGEIAKLRGEIKPPATVEITVPDEDTDEPRGSAVTSDSVTMADLLKLLKPHGNTTPHSSNPKHSNTPNNQLLLKQHSRAQLQAHETQRALRRAAVRAQAAAAEVEREHAANELFLAQERNRYLQLQLNMRGDIFY